MWVATVIEATPDNGVRSTTSTWEGDTLSSILEWFSKVMKDHEHTTAILINQVNTEKNEW